MPTKHRRREERRRAQLARRREQRRDGSQLGWVAGVLATVFLLSGSAGLVHEVVWVRLMGHLFGATSLAVATVLAAYMGGLALGSYAIGRKMNRLGDRRRVYALLEIGIGLFALFVPLLLQVFEPLYGWMWQRFELSFATLSVLRFVIAGGLLLGPTAMMGATLPVLADYFAGLRRGRLAPQWLYTVNLAGAVFGVALGGFFLMPGLGLWRTIVFGAAVNIAVGLVVLRLPRLPERDELPPAGTHLESRPSTLLLAAALLSGIISFAGQVAWTRVLVLVVGSTVYAFSTVLLIYLVALTVGAWCASRWGSRVTRLEPYLAGTHLLMALCLVGAVYAVNHLPFWYFGMFGAWSPASLGGIVALNTVIVFVTLILPVLFAGTILPLVMIGGLPKEARNTGATIGTLYAINTIGGILGAVLGGFLFIPSFGSQSTLLGVAVTGAVMGVVFATRAEPRRWLIGWSLAAALVVIAGALTRPDWDLKPLNAAVFERRLTYRIDTLTRPTANVLYYREGPTATVMVLEDKNLRSLRINGRPNASDGPNDMSTHTLLAQIPLLLAATADEVLVVGYGSGVSVGSALQAPVEQVTAVELEPAVIESSRFFAHVNHNPLIHPRFHLYQDDVRHILRASEDPYHVIISGPSHPWVTGVASLFTQDFFELAARRLTADGLFAQWLQAYEISPDTYRTILATFQSVFPEVMVFRSTLGDSILLGSRRPILINLADLEARWSAAATRAENARIGLERPEDLLALLYAGPEAVRVFVEGAPINTDDNMHVEFRAPQEMVLPPVGAIAQIFTSLEQHPTPFETVLTDPSRLLHSRDRLEALVGALAKGKRSVDPYRKHLEELTTVSKETAKRIAARTIPQLQEDCGGCESNLVFFVGQEGESRLAYRVFAPVSLTEAWAVMVDADTGAILDRAVIHPQGR